MDPSSLKVVELRKELASRGLSTTGKKDALVQRLKEALSLEKVEGKCAEGPGKEDQAVKDNPMAPTSPESNDTISNPVPSTKQANSPNENELTTDKRKVESIDEREEKVCASNDEQVSPSDPGERRKGGVKRKARSPSPCETMARSTTSGVVEGPEDQEESRENNVLSKKRRSFTGQGGFNRLFDSAMTSVHHPGNQAVIRQSAQRAQPTSTEEAGARQIPQFPQTQSTVLCTRNFVRPLRVPQVRELMMSFGEVEEFWMDPLKSRCYVRYPTLDEACRAWKGLWGLQFPPETGKRLSPAFLHAQDLEGLLDEEKRAIEQDQRLSVVVEEEGVIGGVRLETEREAMKREVQRRMNRMKAEAEEQRKSALERQRAMATTKVLGEKSDPAGEDMADDEVQEIVSDPSPQVRVLSLDELFSKTKADPPLYFRPWTVEEVEERANLQTPSAPTEKLD